MQAGGSDHIDQGIETKQFDLAAHEVGDTRLRPAAWRPPIGLGLSGDMIFQCHHQRRTELHVLSLRGCILNCVPHIGEALLTH